ncbi:MAG: MBL fold metallo-hydrolase [Eubacteriales bacterium]|nr:MBL fold metallo-hydrolase [Eubacteriales bacterium]
MRYGLMQRAMWAAFRRSFQAAIHTVLDETDADGVIRRAKKKYREILKNVDEFDKGSPLGVDPAQIRHIFITHQDTDHVGAVEADSDGLFRDAMLYIGEVENRYLTAEKRRRVYFGAYKLPQVTIKNQKTLLTDGQIVTVGDIRIECILVPGHSWGHLVYLIDEQYLFTGDTLWLGADGGYSFLNVLAEDNKTAVRSLNELERRLRERGLRPLIITGHTGWTDDLDFAFAHTDRVCNALRRQKPHDPAAPYDAYDESEDTELAAKTVRLEKVKGL